MLCRYSFGISDAFEELHQRLKEEISQGADPEDRMNKAEKFCSRKCQMDLSAEQGKEPTIGNTVDDAMDAIEKENLLEECIAQGLRQRQS